MSDDDAGHCQFMNGAIDLGFTAGVEMAGGLVEYQHTGPLVQRARQQHPLFLAARQGGTHIAHQRLIGHRHLADFVMHRGKPGTHFDVGEIGFGVEKTDVVGD